MPWRSGWHSTSYVVLAWRRVPVHQPSRPARDCRGAAGVGHGRNISIPDLLTLDTVVIRFDCSKRQLSAVYKSSIDAKSGPDHTGKHGPPGEICLELHKGFTTQLRPFGPRLKAGTTGQICPGFGPHPRSFDALCAKTRARRLCRAGPALLRVQPPFMSCCTPPPRAGRLPCCIFARRRSFYGYGKAGKRSSRFYAGL
jgi:hypothetical protein